MVQPNLLSRSSRCEDTHRRPCGLETALGPCRTAQGCIKPTACEARSPCGTASASDDSSEGSLEEDNTQPQEQRCASHRVPSRKSGAVVLSSAGQKVVSAVVASTGEEVSATASGTLDAQRSSNMCQGVEGRPPPTCQAPRLRKIYGRLPKFSPFLGTFHHAPGAGNRSRTSFFERQIVTEEEIGKARKIKANPFTGTFHYFPGRYSALHGLQRFRYTGRFRHSFDELDRLEALGKRVRESILQSDNPSRAATFMAHMFSYGAPPAKQRRKGLYPHRSGSSLDKAQWGPVIESLVTDHATGSMRYRYGGAVDMLRKFGSSLDDGCLSHPSTAYRDILHHWNGFRLWYVRMHPRRPRQDDHSVFIHRSRSFGFERMSPAHSAMTPGLLPSSSWAGTGPDRPLTCLPSPTISRAPSAPTGFRAPLPTVTTRGSGFAPPRSLPSTTRHQRAQSSLDGSSHRAEMMDVAYDHPQHRHTLSSSWVAPGLSVSPKTATRSLPRPVPAPAPAGAPLVTKRCSISDKYNVRTKEMLGEGSFASVVCATHKETGQSVAIKAIKRRYLFTEEDKGSVKNEIDNMFRMAGHRNIIRLFETFETPEHIYLVVERATHGSLEQILQLRRKLTELEAMWVTKQLLDAVDCLHANGVVHCDLKPDNLLFSDVNQSACLGLGCDDSPSTLSCKSVSRGPANPQRKMWLYTSPLGMVLKLCDFGLSRKVPDVRYFKHTGDIHRVPFSRVCGTGGYIAPEIMRKQPYGKPADLWSIGVITYRMLSGAMPFIPPSKCLERPVSFRGRVWDQVTEDAKAFCRSLLEVEHTKRATARDALGHHWMQTVPEWGPQLLLKQTHGMPAPRDDSVIGVAQTRKECMSP